MREITITNRFVLATQDEARKALVPQPSEGATVILEYCAGQDADSGALVTATVDVDVATMGEARERARRVVGLPFVKSVRVVSRETGRELKF